MTYRTHFVVVVIIIQKQLQVGYTFIAVDCVSCICFASLIKMLKCTSAFIKHQALV